MDTACSLEATVACGEIFSEVVNILQTERYFSRTFLEIFAIFINYPPVFVNSAFQNIEQKFRVYVAINVTRNFIFPLSGNDQVGSRDCCRLVKICFPGTKKSAISAKKAWSAGCLNPRPGGLEKADVPRTGTTRAP